MGTHSCWFLRNFAKFLSSFVSTLEHHTFYVTSTSDPKWLVRDSLQAGSSVEGGARSKCGALVASQERKIFLVGVLCFGWPGRPSSGAVVILHWCVIFVLHVVWWPEVGKNG